MLRHIVANSAELGALRRRAASHIGSGAARRSLSAVVLNNTKARRSTNAGFRGEERSVEYRIPTKSTHRGTMFVFVASQHLCGLTARLWRRNTGSRGLQNLGRDRDDADAQPDPSCLQHGPRNWGHRFTFGAASCVEAVGKCAKSRCALREKDEPKQLRMEVGCVSLIALLFVDSCA